MEYKISEELKKEFLYNYHNYGDYSALETLRKEQVHFSEKQKSRYHCVMLLNELLDYYEFNYDNCDIQFDTKYYYVNKINLLYSLGIKDKDLGV